MDEDLKVLPEILRAYNNGYLLAEHAPELSQKLSENLDPAKEYSQAFIAGKQEHDREQSIELPEGKAYMDYYNKLVDAQKAKDYFKSFDRGGDKDRDKDKGPKR